MPQRDRRHGARQDGEAHAVRQGKVGRQTEGADLAVAFFVKRKVRLEDLEDVEALRTTCRQFCSAIQAQKRA